MSKTREAYGPATLICTRCAQPQALDTAREHACRGGRNKDRATFCKTCNEAFFVIEERVSATSGKVRRVKVGWKGREIVEHIIGHILDGE